MHTRRPTASECVVTGLILFGLVFAILDWRHALGVIAIGTVLAVFVTSVVALPSFVVFLCWERSFHKAIRNTGTVAACCVELVCDLTSGL